MQGWSRFWQRMTSRPLRHSWGLAHDGAAWALVGLVMHKAQGVKVHTNLKIDHAEEHSAEPGFSAGLSQVDARAGRSSRRLHVSLSADQMVFGALELPVQWSQDAVASEVQLEVSQMLGLGPQEVHFDFQPEAFPKEGVRRQHWVGCAQSQIDQLTASAKAAHWQIASVEPAWHAAQRAAQHLQGGLVSLLTQPTQDWQFQLPTGSLPDDSDDALLGRFGPDFALEQAMKSSAGPRLVASGLALKAWL